MTFGDGNTLALQFAGRIDPRANSWHIDRDVVDLENPDASFERHAALDLTAGRQLDIRDRKAGLEPL